MKDMSNPSLQEGQTLGLFQIEKLKVKIVHSIKNQKNKNLNLKKLSASLTDSNQSRESRLPFANLATWAGF